MKIQKLVSDRLYLLLISITATLLIDCTNIDHYYNKNLLIDINQELDHHRKEYTLADPDYLSSHYEEKDTLERTAIYFTNNVLRDPRSSPDEIKFALYISTDYLIEKEKEREFDNRVREIKEIDEYIIDIMEELLDYSGNKYDTILHKNELIAQSTISNLASYYYIYDNIGTDLHKKKILIYQYTCVLLEDILNGLGLRELWVLSEPNILYSLPDVDICKIFGYDLDMNLIRINRIYFNINYKKLELLYNLCQDYYNPNSPILRRVEILKNKYLNDKTYSLNSNGKITFVDNPDDSLQSPLQQLCKRYIQLELNKKYKPETINNHSQRYRKYRSNKNNSQPKPLKITSFRKILGDERLKQEINISLRKFLEGMIQKKIMKNHNDTSLNKFLKKNSYLSQVVSREINFLLNHPSFDLQQELEIFRNQHHNSLVVSQLELELFIHLSHYIAGLEMLNSESTNTPMIQNEILRIENYLEERYGIKKKGKNKEEILSNVYVGFNEYINGNFPRPQIKLQSFKAVAMNLIKRKDYNIIRKQFKHDKSLPAPSYQHNKVKSSRYQYSKTNRPLLRMPTMEYHSTIQNIPVYLNSNSEEKDNDKESEIELPDNISTENTDSVVPQATVVAIDPHCPIQDDLNDQSSDSNTTIDRRIFELLSSKTQQRILKIFPKENPNPKKLKGSEVISLINYLSNNKEFRDILNKNKVSYNKFTREKKAFLTVQKLIKITLNNLDHSKEKHNGRKNQALPIPSGRRIIQVFNDIGITPV